MLYAEKTNFINRDNVKLLIINWNFIYKFSLGKSIRKLDNFPVANKTTPKSGFYDFKSKINEAKSFKFSKEEKLKPKRSITPGPGKYDI